jgi:hypothetical protein
MKIRFQRAPPQTRPGPKKRVAYSRLEALLVLDDGQRQHLASMKTPPSEGEALGFIRAAELALSVFVGEGDLVAGLLRVVRERAALEHIKAFDPPEAPYNVIDLPREIEQRKLAKVLADHFEEETDPYGL